MVFLLTEFITANGNLLEVDVDALVNTVNTVGVMGKGIALAFKKAFPSNFKAYAKACQRGDVKLGSMFVFDNGQFVAPRLIINFPTKEHWRSKSKPHHIEQGLDDLATVIRDNNIGSIALPYLGCGHGGLDWAAVEPMIRERLSELPTKIHIFAPPGSAVASAARTAHDRPKLTLSRAALIAMIDCYTSVAIEASIIEVQNLMYFLQEAGQPLQLRYESGRYSGPYANNLRHLLNSLDGHHLQGYGDGRTTIAKADPIRLLPDAAAEAKSTITTLDDTDLRVRMERTTEFVEGFESAWAQLCEGGWLTTATSEVATAEA